MARRRWTRDGILEALNRYAELTGYVPAACRIEKDRKHLEWLPCHRTVLNHFGTWNNAIRAAGFPVVGRGNRSRPLS